MTDQIYKGNFRVWTEENILFAVVSGAWNKDTAIRYVKEFKSRVDAFSGQQWAQVVCLDEWILGTPEIEPIIGELANWNLARNLRCTAFVHSENSLKRYQIENMLVEKHDNYTRMHFDDSAVAFSWIAEQGFSTNRTNFLG